MFFGRKLPRDYAPFGGKEEKAVWVDFPMSDVESWARGMKSESAEVEEQIPRENAAALGQQN